MGRVTACIKSFTDKYLLLPLYKIPQFTNSCLIFEIYHIQHLPSFHNVCHHHHQEWGQLQGLLFDLDYAPQPPSKCNVPDECQEDTLGCLLAGHGT